MAKRTGDFYIKQARKAGCTIKPGHGDHFKAYPPGGGRPMSIPQHLKGNGTEHAIIKWLLKLGILVTLVLGIGHFLF